MSRNHTIFKEKHPFGVLNLERTTFARDNLSVLNPKAPAHVTNADFAMRVHTVENDTRAANVLSPPTRQGNVPTPLRVKKTG